MDLSDSDSDLERHRKLMFLAVSERVRNGSKATEEDRCREVKGYLDNGVNINAVDEKGDTVLHIAVKRGLEGVVEFLRERGAKADIRNQQGYTARELAEFLDDREIANMLTDSVRKLSITQPVASTSGMNGIIYQVKHLVCILRRASKMNLTFRLTTEMESAEKFDDLVFEYENKDGNRMHRFMQLKHKQDDAKLIRVADLSAGKKNDFSLQRYLISWRRIKKHPDFAGSQSKIFILCTNIDLDLKGLENKQIDVIPVTDSDAFLKITNKQEQPPRYKLRVKKVKNCDLCASLKSASDARELATELAKCVYDALPKSINLTIDVFRYYQAPLAKEVLDIDNKKFSEKFIENNDLSKEAKDFRRIFFKYAQEKYLKNKTLTDRDFQNNLRSARLKISEGFAESSRTTQQTESVKLPNDDIIDDDADLLKEINTFLDDFILAVKQPNEVELGRMMRHEFGEDSQFNLLNANLIKNSFESEIMDWFKRKQGQFLVSEDIKKLFHDLVGKIASLVTAGLNLNYAERLKNYDVEFKREIEGLRNFLDSSKETKIRIWQFISSKQFLLTALRICQTLCQVRDYEKDDSYIFIDMESLKLEEIRKRVLEAFETPSGHNLLVIDGCSIGGNKYKQKLWDRLFNITKKNPRKRLILITEGDHESAIEFEKGHETFDVQDDDISIDNVDPSSLRKLLEKMVVRLQGHDKRTSFARLLGIDDDDETGASTSRGLGEIINSNTLVDLIQDKEIRIGDAIKGLGEIEKYYIPRHINPRVVIREDILMAPGIDDMFAISGIDTTALEKLLENVQSRRSSDESGERRPFRKNKFIILENNRETDDFASLCQRNSNRNIHWLQFESKKLVWKRSSGKVTNLIEYREESRGDNDDDTQGASLLTEEKIAVHDEQRKIVILSDTAGMGKSTVLTRLAEKIRENEPSLLVMKIDLTDYSSVLASEKEERTFDRNNIDGAVDFLVDKLNPGMERMAISLFKRMIKVQRQAALLFDGFDEISPDYKETVIHLLQALEKLKMTKLFVTTRPHTTKTLEEKLGVFSYALQPFSERNQIDFLAKFWQSKAKFQDSVSRSLENKESLRQHAQNVISLLARSIEPAMKEFTGVPLQTRLVAEIFPIFEKPELPETISIIEMYSKFVDKKYDIFGEEKQRVNYKISAIKMESENRKKALKLKHQTLALHVLFDKTTVAKLLSTQPTCDEFDETCQDTISDRQRTGIVTLERDDKIRFIHRTFAEYFAAIYLLELLQGDRRDRAVRTFFVAELFVKRDYRVIRAFLNPLLAGLGKNEPRVDGFWKFDLSEHRNPEGETAYHVVATEGHAEIAKFLLNILREDREDQFSNINCPSTQKARETPLHSAARSGHLDIVKYYAERGADINSQDKVGKTPLHSAAVSGHLDVVKRLAERGADINSQDEVGKTPLHSAAVSGHLDVVKRLAERGADINSQDKVGKTPLHSAASSGHLDVVKHLADRGAYIHFQDEDGETPLHSAASSGHLDVVKHLAERGADINSQDEVGKTPLYSAARSGHLDVVKHLAERGADINSQDEVGKTPLYSAARSGHLDVVKHLAERGAHINSQDEVGKTPLHSAAIYGHLDVVKHLAERGADINSQDEVGKTPLYSAAVSGHLDVVKYLAERGVDINSQTNDGWTLLHSAASSGHLDVVKHVAERGADIHSQDKVGKTPLHSAAVSGHLDVVKYLAERGADINSQDKVGKTPLHSAAVSGHLDVVKYLAERGADIHSQDKVGKTPLHHAVIYGHLDVVKHLADRGAYIHSQDEDGETPLHSAASSGHLDVVKHVAERGADIHSQDKVGKTPLHSAAVSGHLDVVKYLAERGADIHSQDKVGKTPLHSAAVSGHLDVVKYLAERGVDINSQTNDGWTLLHSAASSGHLDVVKHVAERGADINSQDKVGKTPLHSAAVSGHLDVVKYLAERGADIHSQDKVGKTPLHHAVIYGHLDVVKHLADRGAYIHSQDEDGETPLHSAAVSGHLDVVKYLAERGVDINSQDKYGWTLLNSAAVSGNLDVVKYLAERGVDINSQDKYGWTLLNSAAVSGNLDVVKYLAERGADINSQDKYGWTLLNSAAVSGNLDVVKYLAERGADINSQDKYGWTLLNSAAVSGNLDVVKYYAERGVDINSQTNDGWTLLHSAAISGHLDVVKYLAERGADINSQDKVGKTPLHYAASSGHLDVVKHLAERGADINSQDEVGKTPLHSAAVSGHLDVVKYLAERGADINSQDKYGWTLLNSAAVSGNLDVVKYLAERGVDINSQDKYGETPLHSAASSGRLDVVKYLAERGVDINSQDKFGKTPLHYAASSGHLDVVKYLAERGVDINSQDKFGETPLHYAASSGHLDVVKYLAERGVDINSQDKVGKTPLHYAAVSGHLDVVKYLAERGADIHSQDKFGKTPLRHAVIYGHLDVVKYLAERGADINSQDEVGKTPLHSAAVSGHLDVVKYLAERGADINSQDKYGETPLHSAASSGHLDVVKYLAERGADINSQDEVGKTPLHSAAVSGHLDVVKYLAERGADINSQDKFGKTPLHHAALSGEEDVVEYLAERGANILRCS